MENQTSVPSLQKPSGSAFYLISLLVLLLPIFFVPFLPTTFQFGKMLILSVFTLLSVMFTAVSVLREGHVEIPKEPMLALASLIPLLYLVSSAFSDSFMISLFGYGFEQDTFFAIAVLCLLLIVLPFSLRTKERLFSVYLFFFISFLLVSVFQLSRLLLGSDFLTFKVLGSPLSNLIGKWTDLGIYFGLGVILSLVAIEFLNLNKVFRVFLYITLILSLFFLVVINFSLVWILLGLFSFILFAYLFSFGSEMSVGRRTSTPALAVIILSIIFIFAGSFIGGYTSKIFKTENIDARPSRASTIDIGKIILKENPITGAGPNRFQEAWLKYKPGDINNTIFWNTDFYFGTSFISTAPITVGILGFLAWLSFLGAFLLSGWKALVISKSDKLYSYLNLSSFLVSLYLWIIASFYTPNLVILSLAFLFTGLFIASASQSGAINKISLNLSSNPKSSFVAVFSLIILIAASFFGIYTETKAFASHIFFQKGIVMLNRTGDIPKSENYIDNALSLFKSDVYLRGKSELAIIKLNILLSDETKGIEDIRTDLQLLIAESVDSAKAAIDVNPLNYQNWLALGRVYESLVGIKVDGAYAEAVKTYANAKELNPSSPAIELILARLDAENGNFSGAKEHIAKALTLKNNYTDAIFLLSQIEVSEGKIDEAIRSVEAAALIAPNDPGVFFQLGLLKYNNEDYGGAISAFERAVILNTIYSNAKYFLGLSYHKVGRVEEAIAQFEDVAYLNPDNAEVKLILQNLNAGRDPFQNAKPPVDENPEKRDKLPIEE